MVFHPFIDVLASCTLLAAGPSDEKLQHIIEVFLCCTALALIVAVAAYVLKRFRGSAEEEQLGASELLSKFRELHSQGGLSDEEFRTIKTLLADKLRRRLKNSGEKG